MAWKEVEYDSFDEIIMPDDGILISSSSFREYLIPPSSFANDLGLYLVKKTEIYEYRGYSEQSATVLLDLFTSDGFSASLSAIGGGGYTVTKTVETTIGRYIGL
jgi:hypothetical protein